MAKKVSIEDICEKLKEKLKVGDLASDSRIVEQELADEFCVSRTPIREAILRLCNEGLLMSVPNLGTFVKRFSISDVKEVFEIREVLEGLAYRNATECFTASDREELMKLAVETDSERAKGNWDEAFRTDEKFHKFIIRHCNRGVLKQELEKFNFQSSLIRADLSSVASRLKRREITVTHTELAKVADNPLKAEKLMREHIAGLAKWLFQS